MVDETLQLPTKFARFYCRRLVRHPNSIRASTNQGRRFILLASQAAALPRLDAGSGGVKPTSSCIISSTTVPIRTLQVDSGIEPTIT